MWYCIARLSRDYLYFTYEAWMNIVYMWTLPSLSQSTVSAIVIFVCQGKREKGSRIVQQIQALQTCFTASITCQSSPVTLHSDMCKAKNSTFMGRTSSVTKFCKTCGDVTLVWSVPVSLNSLELCSFKGANSHQRTKRKLALSLSLSNSSNIFLSTGTSKWKRRRSRFLKR